MDEPGFLRSTRESYDVLAADWAGHFRDELAGKPLDRALLAAFAELVPEGGRVADVGCGTGRTTAHLRELGLSVFGIDLSPGMLEVAARAHPDIRFEVGSMLELPVPEDSLGGVVASYSIIHVPPERLPEAFAEFHRVLAPGGHVLLVFQVGDEPLRFTEAFGRAISLDYVRYRPEHVAELLAAAGLPVHARLLREPVAGAERTQQGYLLASKPG